MHSPKLMYDTRARYGVTDGDLHLHAEAEDIDRSVLEL